MRTLRDSETGCPWDRAQTHETLARYAIEEAYETADAIAAGDAGKLRDELGDLLFQVVFHAQLGQERGAFDFAAVAAGVRDKLERRHPHVFQRTEHGASGGDEHSWETHKARERAARSLSGAVHDESVLADIPLGAPALIRASKLGARAATVGFDWRDAASVRAKVDEELDELETAMSDTDRGASGEAAPEVVEELGDLLFTIAHWARHLRIDPESALRAANAKFERRFRIMERLAAEQHKTLKAYSSAELETLWEAAKGEAGPVQGRFTAPEDN
jgi:ATP diphosphatase